MDYINMTAPCGIACFECIANKANSNDSLRKQLSDRLSMDYEKSSCEGCRNRNGVGFLSEKNNIFPEGKCLLLNEKGECKIFFCAKQHKIHNCSECVDFPCDNFQPLADRANRVPHNLKVYNLCLIKKLGLEKWANEEAGKVWVDYMTKRFES